LRLEAHDGILRDGTPNAGPEAVYAAGDGVAWTNEWWGGVMRAEQWLIAADHGMHAAKNLLAGRAQARPFSTIPCFWSDQYDRRIRVAGQRVSPFHHRSDISPCAFPHGTFAVCDSFAAPPFAQP